MRRAETLLAAALLLTARASPGEEDGDAPGRYKVGPLYLTPRIVLHSAGVDTNVYNSEDEPVRDNTLVLSPGLDLVAPVGRHLRLTGRGTVDLNYFEQEESERSTDIHGTGQAELRLGPASVFAGGGGGRFKQRFSTEIDRRLERDVDEVHGGFRLKLGRRLSLSAQGRQETATHQAGVEVQGEDVKEALDRRSRTGSGQIHLALSSRTTLLALAEVQKDRFLSELDGAPREARSYRYAGGFEFSPKAAIRGTVVAGVRRFPDEADQGAPPFSGLALGVNLQVPLSRFALLTATASRDVRYSVNRVETGVQRLRNTYLSSSYGSEVSLEMPWSLLARGSISIGRSDYVLPYEVEGIALDRLDRLRSAGVSLLRAFGRSLRLGLTIQWSHRESNAPGFSYRATSYGLTGELAP